MQSYNRAMIEHFINESWAFETSKPNMKTKKTIKAMGYRPCEYTSWSLLSGICCPGAKDCKCIARYTNGKGKLEMCKGAKFACFSASNEAQYTQTYQQRSRNTDLALMLSRRGPNTVAAAIVNTIGKAKLSRPHIGGDLFSYEYTLGMVYAARYLEEIGSNCRIYLYTKSAHHIARMERNGIQPTANLKIRLSLGGRYDEQAEVLSAVGYRTSCVVFSEAEAGDLGLKIDTDDTIAAFGDENFCTLLHGTQPKGTKAAEALKAIKRGE